MLENAWKCWKMIEKFTKCQEMYKTFQNSKKCLKNVIELSQKTNENVGNAKLQENLKNTRQCQ